MASEVLLELKSLMDQEIPPYPPLNTVIDVLQRFYGAVAEGGPTVRLEVIEQGAYLEITRTWFMFCDTGECHVRDFSPEAERMREETLKALYSITAGYPEIIDVTGYIMIKQALDTRLPESTQILGLKLMRNVCVNSEQNRENLTTFCRIIQPLSRLIKKNSPSSEFVREWCSTTKSLILNDDKRVAYNRAPERKRMLHQNNVIRYLAEYLNVYREGPTLNSIVIVLGSMACCEDYCIAMYTGNILPAISKILGKMHSNSLLAKNTLSLLRFMNISSIVRDKVCGANLMEAVVKCAWLYRTREDILETALSCIAFMSLRCPCHVAQFLNEDGVNKIMDIIKNHMEHRGVLKGACFILRNVAVHGGKEGGKQITAADGENLLRQIEEKHKDLKANYTKPCLRDLKLPVSPTNLPDTLSGELLSATIGKEGQTFPDSKRKSVELANETIPYPPCSKMFDYPPESEMNIPSNVPCPEGQGFDLQKILSMTISGPSNDEKKTSRSGSSSSSSDKKNSRSGSGSGSNYYTPQKLSIPQEQSQPIEESGTRDKRSLSNSCNKEGQKYSIPNPTTAESPENNRLSMEIPGKTSNGNSQKNSISNQSTTNENDIKKSSITSSSSNANDKKQSITEKTEDNTEN